MALKLILTIIVLVALVESSPGQKRKPDPSMPPTCRPPPRKDRPSLCQGRGGYKYDRSKNHCRYQKEGLCFKHGAFTTLDECVYQCYDYRKMLTQKNQDGCGNPVKEEEMGPVIRVPSRGDDVDSFKDNRCREPTELGRQRGKFKKYASNFRFDKDKNECVHAKDEVCLGRNRFRTKDECVHVCVWNLSSGRHRYIVRASN